MGLVLVVLAGPAYDASARADAGASANVPPQPTATSTPFRRTPTPTPQPTSTATPQATATATPQPTATATSQPTATATPQPAPTDTPQPAPTATSQAVPTATDVPAITPTQAIVVAANSPTASAVGTDHPGINTGRPTPAPEKAAAAPSWLVIGLVALFGSLLLFSLVTVVVARRLNRRGPVRRPLSIPALSQHTGQFSRLGQVPPVRRAPLTREQMLALHEARGRAAGVPKQTTASLPAVRLVDGVPVSLPITEAQAIPERPADPA